MAMYCVTEYERYDIFNLKTSQSTCIYQVVKQKTNLTLTEARLYIQEMYKQYKTVNYTHLSPDYFAVFNTQDNIQKFWQVESEDDENYPTPGSNAEDIKIVQYPLAE